MACHVTQDDLNIPCHKFNRKQGIIISRAVCGLPDGWNVDKSCIKFMSFDTTSANTGHLTAAWIQLQVDTGKAMLWAACRQNYIDTCLGLLEN